RRAHTGPGIYVVESEEDLVKLQTDFASYKACHRHSDSSHGELEKQVLQLTQELSRAEEEVQTQMQQSERSQTLLQEIKLELMKATEQRISTMKDVERLEQEVCSLHRDTASQVQDQQIRVTQQQQQIQKLQEELGESSKLTTRREQAVQKRDALLRQSEADLLQARSSLRAQSQEIQRHLESATGMERRLQNAQRECEQRDVETGALRAEIETLKRELKETYVLHQHA
ncbi:hypothetical protein FKM82_027333, partial [Ascaphus truei]